MIPKRFEKNQNVAGVKLYSSSFTLIEAIIALAVTGIAIAASAALLSTSLSGGELLRNRYHASEIAVSRLEDMRSMPYATLSDLEEEAVTVNSNGVQDEDGQYTRSTVVGNEYHNTREVTVTVTADWKSGQDPVQVDISTIIADESVVQ